MDLIKRTHRLSAALLAVAAAVLLVLGAANSGEPLLQGRAGLTAAGILAGGALALLNLRGLHWGLRGLLGGAGAAAALVMLSFLRLGIMAAIAAVLYAKGLVSVVGLLGGIMLVMLALLAEGLREAKRMSDEEEGG